VAAEEHYLFVCVCAGRALVRFWLDWGGWKGRRKEEKGGRKGFLQKK
jgi:hypothetical protein